MNKDGDSSMDMSLLAFEDHLDFDSGLGPSSSCLRSNCCEDSAFVLMVPFGPCGLGSWWGRAQRCCHYCLCAEETESLVVAETRGKLVRRVCERAAKEVEGEIHSSRRWTWWTYVLVVVTVCVFLGMVLLWKEERELLPWALLTVVVLDVALMLASRTHRQKAGLRAQETLANFLHGQKFELLDCGVQPRAGYLAEYIVFKYLG